MSNSYWYYLGTKDIAVAIRTYKKFILQTLLLVQSSHFFCLLIFCLIWLTCKSVQLGRNPFILKKVLREFIWQQALGLLKLKNWWNVVTFSVNLFSLLLCLNLYLRNISLVSWKGSGTLFLHGYMAFHYSCKALLETPKHFTYTKNIHLGGFKGMLWSYQITIRVKNCSVYQQRYMVGISIYLSIYLSIYIS